MYSYTHRRHILDFKKKNKKNTYYIGIEISNQPYYIRYIVVYIELLSFVRIEIEITKTTTYIHDLTSYFFFNFVF